MATLVISYLHTLVYNPHKALANCFGKFGGHVIYQEESVFCKRQVVLECEMPAGFFSFLGRKKKKEKNLPVLYTG